MSSDSFEAKRKFALFKKRFYGHVTAFIKKQKGQFKNAIPEEENELNELGRLVEEDDARIEGRDPTVINTIELDRYPKKYIYNKKWDNVRTYDDILPPHIKGMLKLPSANVRNSKELIGYMLMNKFPPGVINSLLNVNIMKNKESNFNGLLKDVKSEMEKRDEYFSLEHIKKVPVTRHTIRDINNTVNDLSKVSNPYSNVIKRKKINKTNEKGELLNFLSDGNIDDRFKAIANKIGLSKTLDLQADIEEKLKHIKYTGQRKGYKDYKLKEVMEENNIKVPVTTEALPPRKFRKVVTRKVIPLPKPKNKSYPKTNVIPRPIKKRKAERTSSWKRPFSKQGGPNIVNTTQFRNKRGVQQLNDKLDGYKSPNKYKNKEVVPNEYVRDSKTKRGKVTGKKSRRFIPYKEYLRELKNVKPDRRLRKRNKYTADKYDRQKALYADFR